MFGESWVAGTTQRGWNRIRTSDWQWTCSEPDEADIQAHESRVWYLIELLRLIAYPYEIDDKWLLIQLKLLGRDVCRLSRSIQINFFEMQFNLSFKLILHKFKILKFNVATKLTVQWWKDQTYHDAFQDSQRPTLLHVWTPQLLASSS